MPRTLIRTGHLSFPGYGVSSVQVLSGRPHFAKTSAVYAALARQPSGLMLDVGAAAGHMTRSMLRHSPDSQVIAFEPFPGNWRFIDETVGRDPRVRIVRAAVADQPGVARFQVGKTVDATSPEAWAAMTGYSSVGKLAEGDAANTIEVQTVCLDDYIDRRVVFLKIDVQGAEYKVLLGARKALARGSIDALLVEYSGDENIMRLLVDAGYCPIDNEYLLLPTRGEPDLSAWDQPHRHVLSTGREALRGWPKTAPTDPYEYCAWLQQERRRLGGLQTDLLFVAPHAKAAFLG